MDQFTGVKVISATMQRDRDGMGDVINRWIDERKRASKNFAITDCVVTQSSDNAFHCVTFSIFYVEGTR